MTNPKRTFQTRGRRLSQYDLAKLDAVVRDLFAHGGPQRPSAPRQSALAIDARTYARLGVPARQLVTSSNTGSTAVLCREQRRLIREWGKP